MQAIDPEQPIADVRTMDQWVARSLETRRTPMVLLALFGAVALVLSAIGIYGVLAFGVAQRVREFGIRQALGADRARDPVAGADAGPAHRRSAWRSAWPPPSLLTRYLQTLLFGVGTHDTIVFVVVPIVLLIVAALRLLHPGPPRDGGRSDGGAAGQLTAGFRFRSRFRVQRSGFWVTGIAGWANKISATAAR